jgi:hypothetical protein
MDGGADRPAGVQGNAAAQGSPPGAVPLVGRRDALGAFGEALGFLGLDNIGPIDRLHLPVGGTLEQSDATGWMGFYAIAMGGIAAVLNRFGQRPAQDLVLKFLEHFAAIRRALEDQGLWDEADGLYYDRLMTPSGQAVPVRHRSMVGIIPALAAAVIEEKDLEPPAWPARLSAWHREHPYEFEVEGIRASVDYEPAESTTSMFGGNSNWRGPVWFPLNYLVVSVLERYHRFFGDDFTIEYPTGSGQQLTLDLVARDLSDRLISIFSRGPDGRRPCLGGTELLQNDPAWHDNLVFSEYFPRRQRCRDRRRAPDRLDRPDRRCNPPPPRRRPDGG